MIEFIEVEKKYQADFWKKSFKALDDLSFKIERGALVGFLGANGAGKTTSIKVLLKFIKPDHGHVRYHSDLGSNFRTIFSRIGYIPERPYFYPHLTGKEFLEYMGLLNEVPRVLLNQRIQKWAERFGIDFALERKVNNYSKGMLQRLGFVSALVHDPLLLILDEPLSGLDPMGRRELKLALSELHGEGKTVFFSSHIVTDVEEICNKVVFLEKGRLVYEGSIDRLIEENIKPHYTVSLFNAPKDFYSERMLHCTPDGVATFEIPLEEKDPFLRASLETGANILTLTPGRPSLEEIIYKIRS